MRTRLLAFALVAIGSLLAPSIVVAQSAIAGVVKDTTGAVLPGVTVEASSPALIEKVRAATTNEAGQYRVVDLRPGTYTVTFTLTGFNTVAREGILLEANFVAPLNVELKVGSVQETITVRGETPVVDVQSSSRREVLSQDLLEAIPTGRSFVLMANTVPAVNSGGFDVGGSSAMWVGGSLITHGSQTRDSRVLIDGMVADAMFAGGQCSCIYDNEAQTQEMAVQVGGGNAENQTAGVLVNRIPRTGGNKFMGEFIALYANEKFQGQNVGADLVARGITIPAKLYELYDYNYSAGGPIKKDRLWFFISGRNWASNSYVASTFNPDGSQAVDDNNVKSFPLRLTGQVSQKNRVTALFDWANKVRGHRNLGAGVSPEAAIVQGQPAAHVAQAKWTSTISSKLLLEAGYTNTFLRTVYRYRPEVVLGACHTAFVLCAPGTGYGDVAHVDTLAATTTKAAPSALGSGSGPAQQPLQSHVFITSLSYVTGAHSFKAGVQHRWGWANDLRDDINGDMNQRYRNGTAFEVQTFNTPFETIADVNADLGLFVQETWTTKRLTLNPGLRYDYFNSSIPDQTASAGRFVPARTFAGAENLPNWKDVTVRMGAAFDVFGDGKTALKGNIGQYMQSEGSGFASTYNALIFDTDTRSWTDTNLDDIAQETELGPTSNRTFGVRRNRNPDPDIRRPYQVVYDFGVQRELRPGMALSVSYNKRSYHDIQWLDNLAIAPSNYILYTVPDPRPEFAGQTLPVYSVGRVGDGIFGSVNEFDTNSPNNTRTYNGVDVSLTMRLPSGASLYGGTSTGRILTSTCDTEDANNLRFCDQSLSDVPFQTQFKVSGTYPLPFGVRASASFQSTPGTERNITYQVTRAQVPLMTQSSQNIRLNEPGSLFNDRVNQLDVNLTKSIRINGVDLRPELGMFNLLNGSAVLSQVNAFGPTLDRVNTILSPRLLRIGVTMKF
jgi:carboxypeptidase family protein